MSDELANNDEKRVLTGRLHRMFKIGSMGARVGLSSVASKLRSYLTFDDETREQQLRRAFEHHAEEIARVLGQLKGASMKIGQLLSTDPDMLPEGFSDVIASLQRDAPPMTYDTVVEQIESELGRDIDAIFAYFDPNPIGAASIGQVHRARLDDDARPDVAVKVQYPGVVDALESDLRTLRQLLVLGRVAIERDRLDDYFEEVRDFVLEEANYTQEASQMSRFANLLDERPGLASPRPIEQWCSTQVLTMEYADGEKFDAALRDLPEPRQRQLLKRWIRMYLWLVHEHQLLHGDPHPGNFLLDHLDGDHVIRILDFGCTAEFDANSTDSILELLVACWNRNESRAIELYDRLGFTTRRHPVTDIDPELLREYHEIILSPFMTRGEFDFGDWNPTMDAKKFILRHPSFFALVPPRGTLLYFRALAGIKGLLRKLEATIDVRQLVEEVAGRRLH
jgi:predicted unusual protein kinase regulating ubiquinone biosynthesis (AarF/ABC1/UbiB family)